MGAHTASGDKAGRIDAVLTVGKSGSSAHGPDPTKKGEGPRHHLIRDYGHTHMLLGSGHRLVAPTDETRSPPPKHVTCKWSGSQLASTRCDSTL